MYNIHYLAAIGSVSVSVSNLLQVEIASIFIFSTIGIGTPSKAATNQSMLTYLSMQHHDPKNKLYLTYLSLLEHNSRYLLFVRV